MPSKKITIGQRAYDIISHWAGVEGFVNQMFVWQFKIENLNIPHAKFLMAKLTFEQKYAFLKKQNVFKEKEIEHINKFQTERNILFHKLGIEMMEGMIGADLHWKNSHIIAKKAFISASKAFQRENNRVWKDWPPEPTTKIELIDAADDKNDEQATIS